MYIQNLSVTNFRNFKKMQLTNMRPLTVLFGHNGSGKSSVLAAIEAIFCHKREVEFQEGAPTTSAPFYRGLVHDFHHNYHNNEPCVVSFEVEIRTTKNELERLWPSAFSNNLPIIPDRLPEDRIRITLTGHFEPQPDILTSVEMILETARVVDTIVYESNPSPDDSWLPDHKDPLTLSEREHIGEEILSSLTNAFSNIGVARFLNEESLTDISEDQDTQKVSSFKRRLYAVKHSKLQNDQNKFRAIQELFNKIAGWGELDFAVNKSEGRELDIMTWDNSQLWLPIIRRGAGAEQILVIISDVLLRGAPLIGIEELESNLDEESQKKLYDLLEELVNTEGGSVGQVIATAHSFFYGGELLKYEKWFVSKNEAGSSEVSAWNDDARMALFKPHSYYEEREGRTADVRRGRRVRRK